MPYNLFCVTEVRLWVGVMFVNKHLLNMVCWILWSLCHNMGWLIYIRGALISSKHFQEIWINFVLTFTFAWTTVPIFRNNLGVHWKTNLCTVTKPQEFWFWDSNLKQNWIGCILVATRTTLIKVSTAYLWFWMQVDDPFIENQRASTQVQRVSWR